MGRTTAMEWCNFLLPDPHKRAGHPREARQPLPSEERQEPRTGGLGIDHPIILSSGRMNSHLVNSAMLVATITSFTSIAGLKAPVPIYLCVENILKTNLSRRVSYERFHGKAPDDKSYKP